MQTLASLKAPGQGVSCPTQHSRMANFGAGPKDGGYLSGTSLETRAEDYETRFSSLECLTLPQMKLKYFVIHSPIESSIPAELCGVLMAGF